MLVRSEMEKRLDALLTRHHEEGLWLHAEVQQALKQPETHHLFVVFANLLRKLAGDHDYSWAYCHQLHAFLIQLVADPAPPQTSPNRP